MEQDASKIEKRKIYYARTYRYLNHNKREGILYLLLLMVPGLIALLMYYGEISAFVCEVAARALQIMLPGVTIEFTQKAFIPFLDSVTAVVLPTTYPMPWFVAANVVVSLLILLVLFRGKGQNNPLSIFLSIVLFIHLINCSFFFFAAGEFPYTSGEYSGLYMQQQVGVWLSFEIMAGLVTGILGSRNIPLRMASFFGILLYSFIFGVLRYIFALYIVYRFSILYVAMFFFALGPFFDFLYFVAIYGIFLDRIIKNSHGEQSMEEWRWS